MIEVLMMMNNKEEMLESFIDDTNYSNSIIYRNLTLFPEGSGIAAL